MSTVQQVPSRSIRNNATNMTVNFMRSLAPLMLMLGLLLASGTTNASAAVPHPPAVIEPDVSVIPWGPSVANPDVSVIPWGASAVNPDVSVIPWGASAVNPDMSVIPWGASAANPDVSVIPWGASAVNPDVSVIPWGPSAANPDVSLIPWGHSYLEHDFILGTGIDPTIIPMDMQAAENKACNLREVEIDIAPDDVSYLLRAGSTA